MAKKSIITVSSVAAGIVLISVVSVIALRGDKGPDFTGKSPEEIKEYFKSDAFQNMNERDQRAAKERAYGSDGRRQEQAFIEQARIYSRLPPRQKIRFLDERIDEYVRAAEQKQEGARQKSSGAVSRSGSGAKGGSVNTAKARAAGKPSLSEGIRAWSEKMDPEQRAHILELKEAMTQRMEQRGIDMLGQRK
jgi:hypothetical protein